MFTQLFVSCSKKKEENTTKSGSLNSETNDLVKEEKAEEKKLLTPQNAQEFEPIPAKLLFETWKAWEGKKIQVTGYLDLFWEKGKLSFQSAKLTEQPGDKKAIVEVDLVEKDDREYNRNVPVTIEGKFKGYWGFNGKYTVKLIEGKIIADKADLPTETIIDPNALTKPVSAKALYDNYVAWLGKEITVVGYANGVTTSTTSKGKTVRIDLCKEKSFTPKYCGVRVADESQALSAKEPNKQNRKYRGVFAGQCFGIVCLENAVEVK